jgi:hypothetical protein
LASLRVGGREGAVRLESKEILCEDVKWFRVPHIRANCMGPCNLSRVMCRLMTGVRSEKLVVRRFRHCANVYLHKLR